MWFSIDAPDSDEDEDWDDTTPDEEDESDYIISAAALDAASGIPPMEWATPPGTPVPRRVSPPPPPQPPPPPGPWRGIGPLLSQAEVERWSPLELFLVPTRMDMVERPDADEAWGESRISESYFHEEVEAPDSREWFVAGEVWNIDDPIGPALEDDLLSRLDRILSNLCTVMDWELPGRRSFNDDFQPEEVLWGPGIVRVEYPRTRTVWALKAFARAAGWRLADQNAFFPINPVPPEERELALKSLEYDVHLPPYTQIGEPGWATEARLYFERNTWDEALLWPCSEEEIQAAEARCGRPLPEKLRTWLAELGQHDGALEVDLLRPMDPAELPPDMSAEDRARLTGTIALGNGSWLNPDSPHQYHCWHNRHLEPDSLESFLSCVLNENRWVPLTERGWLTRVERGLEWW
ncbi:MAG: hypothetical protein Q4G46_09865 [Propionibacteriaceae bacterium]|nr:hypothetical protein [Propionibacteriaceae bacterium]